MILIRQTRISRCVSVDKTQGWLCVDTADTLNIEPVSASHGANWGMPILGFEKSHTLRQHTNQYLCSGTRGRQISPWTYLCRVRVSCSGTSSGFDRLSGLQAWIGHALVELEDMEWKETYTQLREYYDREQHSSLPEEAGNELSTWVGARDRVVHRRRGGPSFASS